MIFSFFFFPLAQGGSALLPGKSGFHLGQGFLTESGIVRPFTFRPFFHPTTAFLFSRLS